MLLVPLALARYGIKWTMVMGLAALTVRYVAFLTGVGMGQTWLYYLAIVLHGIIFGHPLHRLIAGHRLDSVFGGHHLHGVVTLIRGTLDPQAAWILGDRHGRTGDSSGDRFGLLFKAVAGRIYR